jgi:hypothetical protein
MNSTKKITKALANFSTSKCQILFHFVAGVGPGSVRQRSNGGQKIPSDSVREEIGLLSKEIGLCS